MRMRVHVTSTNKTIETLKPRSLKVLPMNAVVNTLSAKTTV
jgi:hypothetical protein